MQSIFHWYSDALKQYTRGSIIALGKDVEDARANARRHFEEIAMRHYSHYDLLDPDEEDIAQRDENLRLLENDIMREPDTISDAVFINGGS